MRNRDYKQAKALVALIMGNDGRNFTRLSPRSRGTVERIQESVTRLERKRLAERTLTNLRIRRPV